MNLEKVGTGTTDICAITGTALWRIDGSGKLWFTNNSFVTQVSENLSSSIKDIVLAKDGVTIFAVGTDGTLFRY